LIDENTLDLKNIASKVLADIDKKFSNNIKCELFESMIEINTGICSTVEESERDVKQSLSHLEEILKHIKLILIVAAFILLGLEIIKLFQTILGINVSCKIFRS
jgi:gamma-glutamyl:cysteine ligase YbdK (ATP-grasp superfamily)